MKPILRILIICMLMLGVAISLDSSTTLAQPPKTKFDGYRSGLQIVNLESGEATITIMGYKDAWIMPVEYGDSISPNGSKTYVGTKNPLPVGDAFSGSLIISSTTKIAAISNILDSSGKAFASYVGRSSDGHSSGRKIFIPLLRK